MQTLEIQHICGYLPHGLKVIHNEWGEILTMDCSGSSSNSLSIEDVAEYAKPLLRPLSDLTQQITHKGETFVPMDILIKLSYKSLEIYQYIDAKYNIEFNIETEDYSQNLDLFDGVLIFKKLEEWLFDVNKLIDAGLAINVNTLKTNPYA